MRRTTIVVAALLGAVTLPALVSAHAVRGAPNCPIFPPNNPWNQRVDKLPVASNSAAMITSIGSGNPVHPDFGSGFYAGGPIGIPISIATKHTRRARVSFDYNTESDRGPYPIPRNVQVEGGANASGDRHVIIVDRANCKDYELYAASPLAGGRWHAGSGAIFNLHSNHLRPAGWTSADAAGLPILPGLARYDEVKRGVIDHALRFTAPCTAHYVYPARHETATACPGGVSPPMGLRVRLKASVDIAGLPYQARVVAQALKKYGLILADNGSPWFISGAPDPRWSNNALHLLNELQGSDFEVVNTSSLPHPGL